MQPLKQEPFYHACREIIQLLMAQENAYFFFKPVDPENDGAPDYFQFVTEPMSFYKIQTKLDNHDYKTPNEFIRDMNLIWTNAKLYNKNVSPIFKTAEALSKKFNILVGSIPHVLTDAEKNNNIQRLVELRFARYRANKTTHQ